MQENSNIFERIMQISDKEGYNSLNDFAKNGLGYKSSEKLNRLKDPKNKPSIDIITDISNKFEDVDLNWLIRGKTKSKENLTLSNGKEKGKEEGKKPNVKKTLPNESITNSITESITNQMYKKGYTSVEEIEKGVKLYQVNEDIDQYKGTGIPLIPIEAMAGFGAGDIQVMDYETSSYRVPEFTELKADFMIRVKGSSMYPKYSSGDLVACKKLYLSDIFFQWNKVYVLDTAQGAIIKRVKKGTDKEHILLVSENPNYDPFELHLSQVNALALVVGVIRLE